MSFRALVINPWVVDFKLYDEWMHPVGLYFLIALLRQSGADVRYVNCLERQASAASRPNGTGGFPARPFPKPALYNNVKRRYKLYGIPEDELISRLSSFPAPDAVFVGSSMTYWLPGLAETVRVVKSVYPRAPVIVGGTSAQLIPAAVRNACPGAHVFRGTLFDQSAMQASGIPFLSSLQALTPADSLVPAFELLAHAHFATARRSLPWVARIPVPTAPPLFCTAAIFPGLPRLLRKSLHFYGNVLAWKISRGTTTRSCTTTAGIFSIFPARWNERA